MTGAAHTSFPAEWLTRPSRSRLPEARDLGPDPEPVRYRGRPTRPLPAPVATPAFGARSAAGMARCRPARRAA